MQPTVADERRGAAPVVGVLLLVALTVLLGATVAFTILGGPPEGRTGTYAFTTTESGDALVFTVEAAADPQELIVSADGTEIGRGTPSAGEGIRVTDLPAGTTVRLVRETGGRSFVITEATAGRQFGTGTTPRLTTGGVEFHAIGETGRVDISADAGAQTLRFDRSYDNPIVVVKPLADGGDPAHVRVRDVTSTSAQVNVEEWEYLDGTHDTATASYLVVEQGSWTLPDGTHIQAGNVTAGDGFQRATFANAYVDRPVVVAASQTRDTARAVVTRTRSVARTGFDVQLQTAEAVTGVPTERVGYVALTEGSSTNEPLEAGRTGDTVTQRLTTVGFNRSYADAGVVADMQTRDGPDTARVRYRSLTGSSVQVFVAEERSRDSEARHTTEVVGYVAFEAGTAIEAKPR